MNEQNRREFLEKASAALVVLGGTEAGRGAVEDNTAQKVDPRFQPKEYWEARMHPPDDGKRYGWFVDTRRCFGCHGCEVSCAIPLGEAAQEHCQTTFYQALCQLTGSFLDDERELLGIAR